MSPLANATLLGFLQGSTEFLPVSSSGHVSLAALVFQLETAGPALNATLSAGVLLAMLLVLWQRVAPLTREAALGIVQPRRFTSTAGGRDALVVVIASLPTALLEWLLAAPAARFAGSPTALGFGFLLTTLVLLGTRWIKFGEMPSLSAWGAFALGVAQGVTALPGISRSGVTIALALWLGVRKDRAFELAMLVSMPSIVRAALSGLFNMPNHSSTATVLTVGAAVAFASGTAALLVLRKAVLAGRFAWFALWVGPLALATLAMAKAWPVR